jgi:hypothetical protein
MEASSPSPAYLAESTDAFLGQQDHPGARIEWVNRACNEAYVFEVRDLAADGGFVDTEVLAQIARSRG